VKIAFRKPLIDNHSHLRLCFILQSLRKAGGASLYICLCHGVTDSAIREAARNGVRSFKELSFSTGCGLQCGSCAKQARAVLDECQLNDRPTHVQTLSHANAA
jgi:bacterioferritin-associated ferredoxin